MKTMPDNFVDLTITSPPYDNLRDYEGYDFIFELVAEELYRVTKPSGIVVWIVGDQTIKGSETGTSFKQALYFKEIGFNIHDTMIYKKSNFSTPSSNRYHQTFEYMFVLSKGKPKTFNPIKDRKNICAGQIGSKGRNTRRQKDGSLIETPKTVNKEYGMRHNVWTLKTAGQEKMCQKLDNPAQFSEELVQGHILSWSNKGDLVFDPMCGSGTTCVVAKKLERNYIGVDVSKKYCKIARQNILKIK